MTDGQAQKQLFFACNFLIAAIARIIIKGCKGPDPPRFPGPEYGFCNDKTLSDPPWYAFYIGKTVSAHEHVIV